MEDPVLVLLLTDEEVASSSQALRSNFSVVKIIPRYVQTGYFFISVSVVHVLSMEKAPSL